MLYKTAILSILSTLTVVTAAPSPELSCSPDRPKRLCCDRAVDNVVRVFGNIHRVKARSLREDQTLEGKLKELNLPNNTPSYAGCLAWEECVPVPQFNPFFDLCCTDTYLDPAQEHPTVPRVGLNCIQNVEKENSAAETYDQDSL